ncbi:TniQ protein [Methylorubrum thiocyanatum]
MPTATRLRPTLAHVAGETPTSFVSRLAQLHLSCEPSARYFCADMGLSFGDLVKGRPEALAALADLSGADPAKLTSDAFRRLGDGHVFRGEPFPGQSLLRTALRFCPACLLEDCSKLSRPETMAHGRAIWSIASIRTCPDHGMGFVEIERPTCPSKAHDFAHLLKPLLPDLEDLAERVPRRPASGLETYALDRLAGRIGLSPWLDGLPLHVGMAICESIGMVDRYGREVRANTLTQAEWVDAGESGFGIASLGVAGIQAFMDGLIRTYPYSRSATEGPQAVLGRWFKFLAFGAPHKNFDVVRDLVVDFMIQRMPFGPGETILGRPVERRVLHSVRSASLEMQVHPKRLSKILHAAGVLSTEQMELPYGNATFDAAAAATTLADAVDGLFMTEVGPYIGAGRVQTKLLVDASIIEPMFPKQPDLDHLFRRRDLDAFLDRLLADAVPVDEADADMADIQKAVKRVCCSTIEIVRLVLDRKLAWVGRRTGEQGFAALLVRVSEIRFLMRGSMEGWLTARTIETTMRTTTKVVRNLMERGYLKAEVIVSPLNRCPVTVVSQTSFDEFRSEYATLFEEMETTGIHFREIKRRLTALGLEPSIEREVVGAAFYRRSDLRRI